MSAALDIAVPLAAGIALLALSWRMGRDSRPIAQQIPENLRQWQPDMTRMRIVSLWGGPLDGAEMQIPDIDADGVMTPAGTYERRNGRYEYAGGRP